MNGVSLIIPFFNEQEVLEKTLEAIWTFLSQSARPFEIILGNDGSTDPSGEIAEKFVKEHAPVCRLITNARNTGRGSILSAAFQAASMPIVAYIDADLEIEVGSLKRLFHELDRADVHACTGSKLLSFEGQRRPSHRRWATRAYNFLVRCLLHSPVIDHQCGLKGFEREVIRRVLPEIREKGWAWDTEVLLLLQKRGTQVHEIPVETTFKRKSTVSLIPTIVMFLVKLLQFRLRGLAL